MDIMLTVSYSVKIPKDEFLNSENGYVKEEMRRQLERLFPEEILSPEIAYYLGDRRKERENYERF